ncbi:hypothetical protein [Actinomadura sp. 3N508]|uniref:hypothetical protein n=1 Tax=Actinomadura sp. 3N508 TaxID=3375153 RepID=UPI003793A558
MTRSARSTCTSGTRTAARKGPPTASNSTGYLKASHRELDERTTEGDPYHPHTRAVPVEPGKIEEYVLRL